jgi:putative membrane protein
MKHNLLASLVILVLAAALGCTRDRGDTRAEQTQEQQPGMGEREGASDQLSQAEEQFLQKAATSGKAEVELAKLAEQKATNPRVKEFAGKIANDHSGANEELKQLAERKDLTVPEMVPTEEQEFRDKLAKMSGRQFDQAYMQHMVEDHKKDISEFQKASQEAQDNDVKAFIEKTLPALQQHLQQAQSLAGGTSGERATR